LRSVISNASSDKNIMKADTMNQELSYVVNDMLYIVYTFVYI